jgi:hypothetical protein
MSGPPVRRHRDRLARETRYPTAPICPSCSDRSAPTQRAPRTRQADVHCNGEFVSANITTGATAGGAPHTRPAHDKIGIVLGSDEEFRSGGETRQSCPHDDPELGRAVDLRALLRSDQAEHPLGAKEAHG